MLTPFTYAPEAVILCGGDYPFHSLPLQLLHDAERIVCCDSAAFALVNHGMMPWRIVGDCDSILFPSTDQERQTLERCRHLIVHVAEQESNDLTKAVRYCHAAGMRCIAIVGATGQREDHTLGNIALTIEYMRLGMEVRMYTDHGVFVPCCGDVSCQVPIPDGFVAVPDSDARRTKSTQVSIFNISAQHFQTKGLRYPFDKLSNWWMGTLNEAVSSPFTISADGEYIMYIDYGKADRR